MQRRLAAAFALLMVAGCASGSQSGGPLIDHLAKGRVVGDADHVSVQGGRVDALPFAVIHCSRYHRSAQFARSEGDRTVFNCVPSS